MEHFIAYHNAEKMGYELEPSTGLEFFSKKRALLERAIGNIVWVIQGIPDGRKRIYLLCGCYIANQVKAEEDDSDQYIISGHSIGNIQEFIKLNEVSWFSSFLKSQSNFSLGFDKINKYEFIEELIKLRDGIPHEIEDVDHLTSSQYVEALNKVKPTEAQWEILRTHLAAPNHTTTARHLAHSLGYSNWNTTNLLYGTFAGSICNAIGISLPTNLSILVNFYKNSGAEYEMELRPSVVTALENLGIQEKNWSFQEEIGIKIPLTEGSAYTIQVSAYERNPVARQKCIAHHGSTCSVCGFSFGSVYGTPFDGYIHVHHLKPLASIGEKYIIDSINDLRPVCPNCHAVIHLRQPHTV